MPVKTIVDIKPSVDAPPKPAKEKIEIKDLLADPIEERIRIDNLLAPTSQPQKPDFKPFAQNIMPEPKAILPLKYDPFTYNAEYVRDTIADGTKVSPNQSFTQIWVLRNPGPNAWPAGCSVKFVGGDNMLNFDNTHPSVDHAAESQTIRRSVQIGEEVAFSVVMKAPKRHGTAISYWRLKSPEGTPFGHRLWCHVDVVNRNPTVEDVPETPAADLTMPASTRPRSVNFSVGTMATAPAPAPPRPAPRPVSMHVMPPFPTTASVPPVPFSRVPQPVPVMTHKVFENGTEVQHIENIANAPHRHSMPPPPPPGVSGYQYIPYRPGNAPVNYPSQFQNQALQDYQAQITLLEQQNKRRLMVARQEAAGRAAAEMKKVSEKGKGPASPHAMPPPPFPLQSNISRERLEQLKAQQIAQRQRVLEAQRIARYKNPFGAPPPPFPPMAKPEAPPVPAPKEEIPKAAENVVEEKKPEIIPVVAPVVAPVVIPVTKAEPKPVEAPSPKLELKRVDSNTNSSTKTESSTMVFPTLEKESPTSSTHEVVTAPTSVQAISVGLASPSTVKSEPELFEDAESVELSDASFLTDEEYDILDASDEEYV